jgi:hypothetical protein
MHFRLLTKNATRTALRQITAAVLLWLAALASATSPALAEAQKARPVFEISNVHVDVTAASATAARDQAIQQGQRQALGLLFHKIVMNEDIAKIPTLEDNGIADVVRGLEFNNEKSSGIRYIADLTVSFSKDGIYSLLQRLGIPFSQTPAKPMLFLGVQRYGGTTILWSDQNWWSQAWNRADFSNQLVEFVDPAGDPADRMLINTQAAFKTDRASLQAMAKKYNVDEVVVAVATISQNFQTSAYHVHIDARKYPQASAASAVDVEAAEGETLEAVLDRSATELAHRLADNWKQQTMIYFGETTDLAVHIPLHSLEEWLTYKEQLGNIGAIRKTEVDGLDISEADLTLTYAGKAEQLAQALKQAGIELYETGGHSALRLKSPEAIK